MDKEFPSDIRVEDLKGTIVTSTQGDKIEIVTEQPSEAELGGGNCSCNHSSK
jgi:hypothetical protein